MKSIASSKSYKKRVKELERVSARIAAKMVKLRKLLAEMSKD